MNDTVDIVAISRALTTRRLQSAGDGPMGRAAVAIILQETAEDGVSVLIIERARHDGDPWSGDLAFPGGRLEPGDATPRAAAERETFEEVGLALGGTEYLGRLGDLRGHRRFRQTGLAVSAHVFIMASPGPVDLDRSEVRSSLWFPLEAILDAERHVAYRSSETGSMRFPGILVGEPGRHVVWGLTYRFLELFMEAIEHPLPDRSGEFDLAGYQES